MHDLVVVGGGLAGLSAGYAAREADVLVVEKNDRVGGRLRSEPRGRYWLNWGAHVFAGSGSATGELMAAVGVRSVPVPGNLSALAMNGRLLTSGRVETYPFRVPMPWRSRLAALRAGAKVRLAVARYARVLAVRPDEDHLSRQQRVYAFMNDRSFRAFVGALPDDADALLRPTVTRSAGEPEDISAGAGVGYFHLVWNRGEGLSRNVLGGSSVFPEALAAELGSRLLLGCKVREVVLHRQHAEIIFTTREGEERAVAARHVVMATPAPVTRALVRNLPEDVSRALEQIVYGPYVSAAFLTNEPGPAPWDGCYAIASPKRAFNVVFNMSSVIRGSERERQPGSSIMVFSPARLARELLELDDAEILATYLADLSEIFPSFSDHVTDSRVQRWPLGLAYCFPGRARLQDVLLRPLDRMTLAGDYLGTFYTETAIQTGQRAAARALDSLGGARKAVMW
jgi:protoporphyrinogen/coproporphyrinogen III oxidase